MTSLPTGSSAGIFGRASSRASAGSAGGGGDRIFARAHEVLQTIEGVAPLVRGAVLERVYDLLKHHRRSVLARHGLGNYRGGQKLIAALTRYYAKSSGWESVTSSTPLLHGEGFAFSGDSGMMRNLEYGADIRAAQPMVLPLPGVNVQDLRRALANRGLLRIPRPGKGALLALPPGARLSSIKVGPLTRRAGARLSRHAGTITPVAVFATRRYQRPLLGWFRAWDNVVPRHLAKIDKTFDDLLTEAGRTRRASADTQARAALARGQQGPEFFGRMKAGRTLAARLSERGGKGVA